MISVNNLYDERIKSNQKVITYFTPTFNRAYLLSRVYECLKRQTCDSYVWIIVDDGSKDNTVEIVKTLLERKDVPIKFISKQNGGKHSAFEVALENTETEYFVCMDDDDIYYEQATEVFLNEWKRISNEENKSHIGAIRTLTKADGKFVSNVPITDDMIGKRMDCSTLEYRFKKKIVQENWTCYKVSALKSIDLFPKNYWLSEYHKFFNEGIWQGRFARSFQCRYYYICLEDYRHDTEFSLVRAKKTYQHYIDIFINSHMILNEQLDYYILDIKLLVQMVFIVSILRSKLEIPLGKLIKHTHRNFLKLTYIILYPIAWLSVSPKITKDATYKKLY